MSSSLTIVKLSLNNVTVERYLMRNSISITSKVFAGLYVAALVLFITGCASRSVSVSAIEPDGLASKSNDGSKSQKTSVCACSLPAARKAGLERFPSSVGAVQVGRYSSVAPTPAESQTDLLKVVIKVTLPREIVTVGRGIEYLLTRSGYRLARPKAQSPKALAVFKKPLPEVHRTLGPITLQDALTTIMGSTFNLVVDPVNRLIGYNLAPQYSFRDSL